jgi:formate hydrogenlyase subunit 6/NADH:ubiquinone oxidoreductase subunit I
VCPVGALEQSSEFSNNLAQLSRVPDPILGCVRTQEHSNSALACLGGLSEEHLVALCHSLSGKLTINISECSGCTNRAMITQLCQRIAVLSKAELLEGGCSIVTADSAQDISYRDESVDRRSFFKSFRNSLFQSAAVILSTNNEATERRTEYAVKRIPVRRGLLNGIRKKLARELSLRIGREFDSAGFFEDNCTDCQGCVAICPTGALRTSDSDSHPTFEQSACTGCGLCQEFCLDGALHINPAYFASCR